MHLENLDRRRCRAHAYLAQVQGRTRTVHTESEIQGLGIKLATPLLGRRERSRWKELYVTVGPFSEHLQLATELKENHSDIPEALLNIWS